MKEKVNQIQARLHQVRPLILNITNKVSMDFVANGLLSVGASPIMSHDASEMEELVNLASCVVINIGTLDAPFIALAETAMALANGLKKPIILDPVGAGATFLRTATAKRFLTTFDISIVRGNASEIAALSPECQHAVQTKGVDSTLNSTETISFAQTLSQAYDTVVAMSGATDVICDPQRTETLTYGSPTMPYVVGTGCLLSAVIAAFHAVHADPFEASVYASYFYALAGERAALKTNLPGSFKTYFLDALHQALCVDF